MSKALRREGLVNVVNNVPLEHSLSRDRESTSVIPAKAGIQ
jgi:hypothetical protein